MAGEFWKRPPQESNMNDETWQNSAYISNLSEPSLSRPNLIDGVVLPMTHYPYSLSYDEGNRSSSSPAFPSPADQHPYMPTIDLSPHGYSNVSIPPWQQTGRGAPSPPSRSYGLPEPRYIDADEIAMDSRVREDVPLAPQEPSQFPTSNGISQSNRRRRPSRVERIDFT